MEIFNNCPPEDGQIKYKSELSERYKLSRHKKR
jgi:hypothetical protein